MDLLHQRPRLAQTPGGDLVLIAGSFVVGLAYLDVPLSNAVMFGPAIALQSAIGVMVLTRLFRDIRGSLLLLLGPGSILGGALSFVAFQLVGRGVLGILTVLVLGIAAVATLMRSTSWQPLFNDRMWTIGQVYGLAALALTWEFPELLPAAAVFFILGILANNTSNTCRWIVWICHVLAFLGLALALQLRQDYWWGVTDDYTFLEVLSQHLTRSGPIADWGVLNFSQYHWLPYGWNGLLNELGGRPDTFTTLTRVMPFLYSASLAGSLLAIAMILRQTGSGYGRAVIPAWVILAVNRLDWSGTGTSGVYAAIAGTACVVTLAIATNQGLIRRNCAYLCFALICAFTKSPSILAIALLLLLGEVVFHLKRLQSAFQLALSLIAAVAGVLIGVPLLKIFARVIGRVEVVDTNPGLGQLAELGSNFALFVLGIKHLALIVPVAAVVMLAIPSSRASSAAAHGNFLLCLTPLMSLGLLFDVRVFGNANSFEYFSGPNYFVASLALLIPLTSRDDWWHISIKRKTIFVLGLLLSLTGVLWSRLTLYDPVWNFLGRQIFDLKNLEITLLKFFSTGMQIGTVAGAIACIPMLLVFRRDMIKSLFTSLLLAIATVTLFENHQNASDEISRVRSTEEIEVYIGPPEIREIGQWIKRETGKHDVVATNYMLQPKGGRAYSDFALAAWSDREFLVMGTWSVWFDIEVGAQVAARDAVISLTNDFSPDALSVVKDYGVKWLVVDKENTNMFERSKEWIVVFENKRFAIVNL